MTASTGDAYLEPRLVGDISGRFYVPAYQRGYRWGEVEVRRLLDDIWESRDKPYYLQPVVVKRHGDEWELVDGQQRLTTLFLIFQYMKSEGLQSSGADYSLRYETRADSAAYLEELDPDLSQKNIDFFHIYEAYRCISEWFDGHEGRRQYVANKFYDALFEYVRVIWYEAADDLDAATLFTRLNVGRIPLTDAELVKALLLSRSRGDLGVTDRALEIAAQWDVIERDLRDPELWAFITGKASEDPTHISLLLDTIAGGPTGRDRPLFHTFETLRERIAADPQEFWNEVVDLHSLVLGWHESRDLFHKIGFLIAEGASSFSGLIERSKDKPKSKFEADLDGLIRDNLKLSEADLRELSYQSVEDQPGSAADERRDRPAKEALLRAVLLQGARCWPVVPGAHSRAERGTTQPRGAVEGVAPTASQGADGLRRRRPDREEGRPGQARPGARKFDHHGSRLPSTRTGTHRSCSPPAPIRAMAMWTRSPTLRCLTAVTTAR